MVEKDEKILVEKVVKTFCLTTKYFSEAKVAEKRFGDVLPQNGLRITLGRLVKAVEKMYWKIIFRFNVLSKNELRIALGHLVTVRQLKNNFQIYILSKNGLKITLRRLVKDVDTMFWKIIFRFDLLSNKGFRITPGHLVKVVEKIFWKIIFRFV